MRYGASCQAYACATTSGVPNMRIGRIFLGMYMLLMGVISIFDVHPISDTIVALLGIACGVLLLLGL